MLVVVGVETLDDVDIEDDVDTELEVDTLEDVETDDEVEILVVVGSNSIENATPSSGTSPFASYKEEPSLAGALGTCCCFRSLKIA